MRNPSYPRTKDVLCRLCGRFFKASKQSDRTTCHGEDKCLARVERMKSQNAALTGEAMRSISGNGKTAVIGLTKGREAVVDECDVAWLGAFTWHAMKTRRKNRDVYYAVSRTLNGAVILMHRLIAQPADGQQVDHVNGDGLDNRRCNLRACTPQQNLANRVCTSSTGILVISPAQTSRRGNP
jgi:hypothetical protein